MQEESEKKLALLDFLNIDIYEKDGEYYYENSDEEVLDYSEGNNFDETECNNYMILNETEMEEKWDAVISNYFTELVLPEIPEIYHNSVSFSLFKRNSEINGRGSFISGYDGRETIIKGNWGNIYYIYRMS